MYINMEWGGAKWIPIGVSHAFCTGVTISATARQAKRAKPVGDRRGEDPNPNSSRQRASDSINEGT